MKLLLLDRVCPSTLFPVSIAFDSRKLVVPNPAIPSGLLPAKRRPPPTVQSVHRAPAYRRYTGRVSHYCESLHNHEVCLKILFRNVNIIFTFDNKPKNLNFTPIIEQQEFIRLEIYGRNELTYWLTCSC